jgi:signal transduction histidine kinase
MAESSPAGTQPAAGRHSIGFNFTMTVAVPVAVLALLWTATALATLVSKPARHALGLPGDRATGELALLVGGSVLLVAACVLLVGLFARRLSRDVSDLAAAARQYADEVLPDLVTRLRSGAEVTSSPPGPPPAGRTGSAELTAAAGAIASLERAAAAAAAAEASLRDGLRLVFVSLARRNQSLLQRQLRLIDALEQKAADPAALADLFALDHLTTRMRRHAESLAIMSGAAPGRAWSQPVLVIDVIRAATAEVEDYPRVVVLSAADDAVAAPAVADMIHLLAELIENATMFSPAGTRVQIRAERVANGFAIEIEDRGLGIEPGQLSDLNRQLAEPPDFDLANADRLGLFVGAKLAVRHGVRVSLRPSPYGGTTAIVLMPGSLMTPPVRVTPAQVPAARTGGSGRFPGLDLRSGSTLGVAAAPAGAGAAVGPAPSAGLGPGPAAGGEPGADQGGPPQASARRLPQRTRQASLSPHLRGGPPDNRPGDSLAPGAGGPHSPAPGAGGPHSPEQARDLAASLQTGWRRGRDEPFSGPPRPPGPPGPGDGNGPPPGSRGGEE